MQLEVAKMQVQVGIEAFSAVIYLDHDMEVIT